MDRTGALDIIIGDHEELIIIAILPLTVILMVLLQLARARLPPQIRFVDRGDQQVHLVTWNVLQMQVASPLLSSLSL